MAVEFDVKQALKQTPDAKAEDAALQQEAKEKLGGRVTDSAALAHYKSVQATIERPSEVTKPRLAQAKYWQGDFVGAAADLTKTDPAKAAEYLVFADALTDLDKAECQHTTIQVKGGRSAKGVSVPAKREIQRIYVGSLEKEVAFIKCERCKKVFARSA